MMKTIEVTQSHIDRGRPLIAGRCPIALALKANGIKGPQVCFAWFCCDNQDGVVKLPKKAGDFVERFDDGLPVKPFSFRVKLDA